MAAFDLDPNVVAELESLSDADDPHFFRIQARAFSARCRGLLHNLSDAVASGDLESAREAAHALAGSAAVIGAARFGEICLVVEARCLRGDRDGVVSASADAVDAFVIADGLVRERLAQGHRQRR